MIGNRVVGKRQDLVDGRGGVFEIYGVLVRPRKKKVAIKISRCPRRDEDSDETDVDCYFLELTAKETAQLLFGGRVLVVELKENHHIVARIKETDGRTVSHDQDLRTSSYLLKERYTTVRLRSVGGQRRVYLSQHTSIRRHPQRRRGH
ncbi:MAG: hypothetical protein WCT37_01860 [Patescibacteria group bacterium]|jgi:hypothetical protein